MYDPTTTLWVRLRAEGERDRLGNEKAAWEDAAEVRGCLFAPGTPAELTGEERPDGASVTATAHFPKGWKGDLRGALVSADGASWLHVIGEPVAYAAGAIPGRWDRQVLLGRTDG